MSKSRKTKRIARSFQQWLIILVTIAFLTTTFFL